MGLRSYPSWSFVPETPSTPFSDRFTPPHRSETLVLANLLWHWQDPRFLTSGIPIRTFQADFTIFTDASTQGWGAHMGDSQISGTWTHTDRRLDINCLEVKAVIRALQHWAPGPPGYDCYGQFDSSVVYQQTRRDPLPHLVTFDSRASPLVRGSEHNSPSKAYPRLSEPDYLSRPNQPISTEWSLHPEIVRRIFRVWGTPEVDMFATVLNSHLPRFMSPIPEPRALAVDALSQDWQGRSMYMFPYFLSSAKSFRSSSHFTWLLY